MTDKINEKVINIFARHKKHMPMPGDEKVVLNDDGYYYICIKKDENGHHFDFDKLSNRAKSGHYIVKIMTNHEKYPFIYNYNVPAEKILEFLLPYYKKEKDGTILEINKYYPHELA